MENQGSIYTLSSSFSELILKVKAIDRIIVNELDDFIHEIPVNLFHLFICTVMAIRDTGNTPILTTQLKAYLFKLMKP